VYVLLTFDLINFNTMKVYLASLMFLVSFVSLSAQCLSGNCKEGFGKYKGLDFTFEGTFADGQAYSGKLVAANGDILEGTFQDLKLTGLNCTLTTSDKLVLIGEFKNGNLHNGSMKFQNGTLFKGQFMQNERNETVLKSGLVRFPDKSEMSGTYIDLKLNGFNCEQKYADGRILRGTFKNGDITDGQLIYAENDSQNRDYYEGQFGKNSEGKLAPHGKGWLYYKNNSKKGPNWIYGDCTGAVASNNQVDIPEGTSLIQLKRRDGLFYINGDIKHGADQTYSVTFLFDTGASYIKIPSYLYIALCKQGVIDDKEAEKIVLQTASGDVLAGKKFVIKQIDFKNTEGKTLSIKDVDAVVTPSVNDDNSPILLGNVALSQFSKIELDYSKNLLLIKK
jgi:predicted aspartyl protease